MIVNYVGIWKYSKHKVFSKSNALRDAKMEKLNREIDRLLHLKESADEKEERLRNVKGMVNIVIHLLCYHLLS